MSINGIMDSAATHTNNTTYTSKHKTSQQSTSTNNSAAASDAKTEGVIYESSASTAKTYTQNADLVAKLKADTEQRTAQFKKLVEDMLFKQGKSFQNANDMWKMLASGNFTVDPETAAQAKADIAEDGYWGVKQTSERIFSFAEALTGGDPEKMEKMRDAFIKGFKQATKAWGKELPDISQKTYDAVMKKFDEYGKTEE